MLKLIVATDENNAIGKDGNLPWERLSLDMEYFRNTTYGYPVIMGRKTWESIPTKFKPLAGRTNIVISKTQEPGIRNGAYFVTTIEEAIMKALNIDFKIFVIGGSEIYKLALPYVSVIYRTRVCAKFDNCDAFFPEIDKDKWILEYSKEENCKYPLVFETWYKRNP